MPPRLEDVDPELAELIEYHIQTYGKPLRRRNKIGRNDLCPCGSGKKYKKCCLRKEI